jgi:hypothetical protein
VAAAALALDQILMDLLLITPVAAAAAALAVMAQLLLAVVQLLIEAAAAVAAPTDHRPELQAPAVLSILDILTLLLN